MPFIIRESSGWSSAPPRYVLGMPYRTSSLVHAPIWTRSIANARVWDEECAAQDDIRAAVDMGFFVGLGTGLRVVDLAGEMLARDW